MTVTDSLFETESPRLDSGTRECWPPVPGFFKGTQPLSLSTLCIPHPHSQNQISFPAS
ncbi:rCG38558 [Rattus norvegicus]|uniref:RCG38558 n=1 Tax=Rattus norvegicus TaxID=10116 RepID=A6KM31_RAT|nr:rCG38558 [Rattus norvegicus]